MDNEQQAFFGHAHNFTSELTASVMLAGMVLFEIQARESEDLQFDEILSSLGITEPSSIRQVSIILDLIVHSGETAGIIDSKFASEFRSKYSLPHE